MSTDFRGNLSSLFRVLIFYMCKNLLNQLSKNRGCCQRIFSLMQQPPLKNGGDKDGSDPIYCTIPGYGKYS